MHEKDDLARLLSTLLTLPVSDQPGHMKLIQEGYMLKYTTQHITSSKLRVSLAGLSHASLSWD
jgi:hypothetical protein